MTAMISPLKASGILDARGAERRREWFYRINTFMADHVDKVVDKATAGAIYRVMLEMSASAVAAAARADDLEARLDALESAMPKPRQRVPAVSRRSAV